MVFLLARNINKVLQPSLKIFFQFYCSFTSFSTLFLLIFLSQVLLNKLYHLQDERLFLVQRDLGFQIVYKCSRLLIETVLGFHSWLSLLALILFFFHINHSDRISKRHKYFMIQSFEIIDFLWNLFLIFLFFFFNWQGIRIVWRLLLFVFFQHISIWLDHRFVFAYR